MTFKRWRKFGGFLALRKKYLADFLRIFGVRLADFSELGWQHCMFPNLYLYKYENLCLSVCLFVCLFAFFSAIWNPIGIPFGTKLVYGLEKVLKQ